MGRKAIKKVTRKNKLTTNVMSLCLFTKMVAQTVLEKGCVVHFPYQRAGRSPECRKWCALINVAKRCNNRLTSNQIIIDVLQAEAEERSMGCRTAQVSTDFRWILVGRVRCSIKVVGEACYRRFLADFSVFLYFSEAQNREQLLDRYPKAHVIL